VAKKEFKRDELASLSRDGYRPQSIQGVITAQVEPPTNYKPDKHDSTVSKLDKKADKP
tara:strand:+ start:9188 stop:9361 length:174 start_codon:yes stop_codon:yes gene_type:complete